MSAGPEYPAGTMGEALPGRPEGPEQGPRADLPECLHLIEDEGRRFYILGTAHVSKKSADDVEASFREIKPDAVIVELCHSRYETFRNPDHWESMDIVQVIRGRRVGMLMASLMLSSFQKRIGERFGVRPGAEIMKAMELAEKAGLRVELGDRDVQTTLRRTWSGLGLWDRCRMILLVLEAVFIPVKIKEEDVERMKREDVLDGLLKDLGKSFPRVKRTLIEERDLYLMSSIRECHGSRVLAVVGAGHIPGIRSHWGEAVDRATLESMPVPGWFSRVSKWIVPILIMAVFAYGFTFGKSGWGMVWTWMLFTASFSAIGAAAALAHPLAILTAFAVSPFTPLNPFLASGFFSGLVEAALRKPRVMDCSRVQEDMMSVRGFYSNRFTRVLLVVTLTNIGTVLGSAVAIAVGVARGAS